MKHESRLLTLSRSVLVAAILFGCGSADEGRDAAGAPPDAGPSDDDGSDTGSPTDQLDATDDGADATGTRGEQVVRYQVTISVDWGDLPPPDGAHLSPVVASAHAPGAPFWSAGALASPGLASLATAGDPSGVEDEHTSDCAVVIAEGLSTPSGSTRFTLDVSESCSSVDLATMVGPSPDWFIGVSDLSLRDDGGWLSNVTVPASLWDAGQLEGDSFSAPTGATTPAAPVSDRALSLGTITFERTSNRHVELENLPPASTEITEVQASAYPGNALREVITFKTPEAAEGVVVFWADGDTEARVSEIGPAGTDHRITLVGLRAETTWHFVPAAWSAGKLIAGPNGTFQTGALPDEVPVFELQAKLVSVWDSFYQNVEHRGLTLVDFYDAFNPGGADEAFVILDDEARVVWYEFIPIVIKSQPLNVRWAKSWWTSERTLIVVRNDGTLLELSPTGEVLTTVTVLDGLPLHHEVFPEGEDQFVSLTKIYRDVDISESGGGTSVPYEGDGIIRFGLDGAATWSWSTFDVLNPVDEPYIVSSSDPVQWLSANALARDTDGHYLVSLHLADQVLKIDRNSGELIWRLGGVSSDFAMDLVAGFQRQHNVTSLGDGRYLMFDNGLAERGYSRALELEIDLEEKTASRVWEYKLPKALYSSVTGSATRQMNGNTLMASGGTSTIVEVTRLGEVVWQAKGPLGLMYRAVPVELDAYGPVRLPRLER